MQPSGFPSIGSAGSHSHTIDNVGSPHSHTINVTNTPSSSVASHPHSVDIAPFNSALNTGQPSVDVTMPYMQQLACRKD